VAATAQPAAAAGGQGARILLVEDDPTVAEVLAGLLVDQGYEPTLASHGLAALAELRGGDFDVVVLDLDLPGIDGVALARQLRAQGWKRPIVALTARADPSAESLARQAGCDAFLRKPIGGAALAVALAGLLAPAGESAGAGA
jgi:CheY-like chemotaxis protein